MTSTLLTRLRDARQAAAQRAALRRELAVFTTEDELNDLEAALERYDDSQTRDIRRILAIQRASLS
jgi:hypothetical protein